LKNEKGEGSTVQNKEGEIEWTSCDTSFGHRWKQEFMSSLVFVMLGTSRFIKGSIIYKVDTYK